jgi:prepilin-type N-terminal cleavage/methylation domain-containing protein
METHRVRIAQGRAPHGFTLLEVLLATAILAIIVTIVYGAVARSLRAKNRAEGRAELYAAGREAVLKIADEIEAALPPRPGSDVWFYAVPGQGRVPNDAVQFFRVIRRQFSASRTQGGRAMVTYQLDPVESTPNLFALRREEQLFTPPLFATESSENASDEHRPAETEAAGDANGGEVPRGFSAMYLLDRVAGLWLRYWDPATDNWVDSWDTTAEVQPGEAPSLPGAVEIVLFLADDEGGIHDFRTWVDLPLANLQPTPGR